MRRLHAGAAWLFVLSAFKGSMPWVSALHPVNALALFVIGVMYARNAWRASSVPAA